jgi:protein-S-isoprenylcysteine O-methyltransferase Ste14
MRSEPDLSTQTSPAHAAGRQVLHWLDIIVYLGFTVAAVFIGPREASWYVGLGVAVVFTPFWFLARRQLGRSFSVRPDARDLVTSGLYKRIRHPVYVFGTPAVVGTLMALLGWKALVIGLVIVPVEVMRARREERVLGQAFGPAYAAYREGTWF